MGLGRLIGGIRDLCVSLPLVLLAMKALGSHGCMRMLMSPGKVWEGRHVSLGTGSRKGAKLATIVIASASLIIHALSAKGLQSILECAQS